MPTIHYLNVRKGDCSLIEHASGHATVIDVCNAQKEDAVLKKVMASLASEERGVSGNFNQKKYPVNPISYLKKHGITSVFRFIATHPDMDHLDGIEVFFDTYSRRTFGIPTIKKKKSLRIRVSTVKMIGFFIRNYE